MPQKKKEKNYQIESLVASMMWLSDGKLIVINVPKEGCVIVDEYPEAQEIFVEAIVAMQHADGSMSETQEHFIESGVQLFKSGWAAKKDIDPATVIAFMADSIMGVMFHKIGADAYLIHNHETFRYLSSFPEEGELKSLIYDLFFAKPQRRYAPSPQQPPSGDLDDQKRELLKMLQEMGKPQED